MKNTFKSFSSFFLGSLLFVFLLLVNDPIHAQSNNEKVLAEINELRLNPQKLASLKTRVGFTLEDTGGVTADAKIGPSPFIIGGSPALRNEYPEYTLVVILDNLGNIDGLCGGTLIAANKVLTAGHCSTSPSFRYIAIPRFYSFQDDITQSDLFEISRVALHPSYNASTFAFDVGVLTLDRNFNGPTAAILRGDEQLVGEVGTVIGTGLVESLPGRERAEDILQEVSAPITSNNACNAAWSRLLNETPVQSNMMCAGFSNNANGTCSGDSGGPLFANVNSRRVIVGTVSFGILPCEFNRATQGFARMTAMTDFIRAESPSTSFVRSGQVLIAPFIDLLLSDQ